MHKTVYIQINIIKRITISWAQPLSGKVFSSDVITLPKATIFWLSSLTLTILCGLWDNPIV